VSAVPRVSVIVPVFNAGRWLEQALASVAAQTFRDREVVIVDDGSTDAATLACLEAAATRPDVTVHRTENHGPAAARNLAVERARGDLILPLDADDALAPAYLAKTVAALDAAPPADVCYTWIGLVGGHQGTWRTGGFSVPELLARCTVHVTALYRRAVWEAVGGYDPRFAESWEDWDFWLGAAARGFTARCVPEVLAFYRRTGSSRERKAREPATSRSLMRRLVEKHRALYDAHLDEALANLYAEYASVCGSLERVYQNPAVRAAVWARRLLGAGGRT
jgi:glycosyltransferase involved in cell wall biosynthesis